MAEFASVTMIPPPGKETPGQVDSSYYPVNANGEVEVSPLHVFRMLLQGYRFKHPTLNVLIPAPPPPAELPKSQEVITIQEEVTAVLVPADPPVDNGHPQ